MTPEIKVEKITQKEFDEKPAGKKKSRWKETLTAIKKGGTPAKISGLTRGQVSAGYRAAKDAGFTKVKADYKAGELWVSP